MSTADFADQASECSEAAMASEGSETMERPTKRTRIEIKPYNEIDLSQFALKDKGKVRAATLSTLFWETKASSST